uniref:Acetyl-coenzyme A transporter 1 n=1 Tax=Aceria tosichella TaxID=561515 RepID=A0A6G1SH95_9ACAR
MATNKAAVRTKETFSNLKGDYGNIAFLLLLYVLQGIPIGLSSAVPLLLQNRKVSYSEQALFSFVTWPFSLKLLWAPIVDSVYWRKFGRRKSWLIPVQLGIGLFMLTLAQSINSLLTDDPVTGTKPNIHLLTFIFLMLNFLAATQDIAVDGWALTMLKRRNVGYASTCNTAGQTAGFFIGNVIFLALESADFCNKYLRSADKQEPVGVVTFESFLHHCGWVFLVVTIVVAILKRERNQRTEVRTQPSDHDPELSMRLTRRKSSDANELLEGSSNSRQTEDSEELDEHAVEKELDVRETYTLLLKIIKLPSFRLFAVILLTCKLGFSAPDAVSGLKLVEAGVHKENLALLAVPMVPLQIILPWVISRITCGPRPLDLFVKAYPYRLLFGILFPLIVYWTPMVKLADGTFPTYYYVVLVFVYALHQVTVYSIFVALMAFHASVSDPSIGGSYMTLLNTITNLGGNWPSTTALWLVDKLTIQSCVEKCTQPEQASLHNSSTIVSSNSTTAAPPTPSSPICRTDCETLFDGYYLECAICVIVGFVWLQWGANRLKRIQSLPPVAWFVSINKSNK